MKNFLLIQPKSFLKIIYPKAVWKINTNKKIIYLTFDDGPIAGLTEWVLDELKKYNAKATFFCVGANIVKNPEVFERIKAEGHVVANHTMTHLKGFKTKNLDYLDEVNNCKKLVKNNLFRPPYGQLKRSQYKALMSNGYKIIFWDVISYDYEKISEKAVVKNVISNTKPGSIVLFHDNYKAEKNLRFSLPLFLKHFAHLQYEFNVIES
ncbi:MAG: polysaccharide deacetylase family protein [Bacteroidota bacterium]|nr:polysaccharide deacetylase family protein [Bacteroidota bacterium]MDP3144002.1 polysaccharide deacetylase family protein [Bacteroidota bacterium]